MPLCFFVSDLHGRQDRYHKLFDRIVMERPHALLLGGDILPHPMTVLAEGQAASEDFVRNFLYPGFQKLQRALGESCPRVFVILGNDDLRLEESALQDGEARGLWEYIHNRSVPFDPYRVYGYACVPPTPFLLKDWERYDVSRYVDPGCVSPEEGRRSVPVPDRDSKYGTIAEDLRRLTGDDDLKRAIFLFHTPPYRTSLDRAAIDGTKIDGVPVDVHVGSIAVQRFIESRQPWITLHGHIHESARLTRSWQDRIDRTFCFTAAHDGPELALVRFDPDFPEKAIRLLI